MKGHTAHAARLGLERGLREFRHTLLSADQTFNLFVMVAFVVVLVLQRDSTVEGTALSLAAVTMPSSLGMIVAFNGLVGPAGQLAVNREDGTLLRAKAVPGGVVGYLVGRITQVSLDALISATCVLVSGLIVVSGLLGGTNWPLLAAVFVAGLLATMPWGAVVGSLTRSPQGAMGLTMLPMMGLTAISGIFYPIYGMPQWVQGVAQVFPVYWVGLGTRSAMLPDEAAAAEIGGSWRHLETFGVLGVWALLGFLLAPTILRRMARRESGADMEQRRQAALQRGSV
ncbi:ABC transporter permease [Saccharothrix coeruleofusca]|uniref:Transport permease protein n=1 Tax=Saccharothrix coeruleofusca TaxID=33919 RepID=A0A918ECP6_9PSEU|nr:ABC transporter permease [Saccharothrix coeruleofusca]MBP2334309.1 ABC-2 type transport system permease protein [Saccharothrix coeruleofusca]GGP41936.1 transport permease protein [Saccharothrix coeruleofusca]